VKLLIKSAYLFALAGTKRKEIVRVVKRMQGWKVEEE
jgi:hypothetical protein